MPLYYYEARNSRGGDKTSGTLSAKTERDLVWQLKQDGLIPIKIEKQKEKSLSGSLSSGFSLFKRVPITEKLMFTRHLAVMIKGGVSLPESLEVLSKQTKSKYFQTVLANVSKSVVKGISLHEAMAQYPGVFSKLYISMVEVGEVLGKLEESLNLIAVQLHKDHQLKSKVKGAMVYPGVILTAMIGIGVIMMIMVVPKITKVFAELDVELPITTRMIIFFSDFMKNNFIWVVVGVVALFFFLRTFFKSRIGTRVSSFILIRTPILRNIVIKINTARFSRSLAALIGGGVPIVRALEIVSETSANVYYKGAIKECAEEVKKGIALNQVLKEFPKIFPGLLIQMVKVGEETGMTADILKELAEFYEDEVDNVTKSLSSIIEPVLMIILGVAVGFFAISMLMPMYSLVDVID